MNRRQRIAVLTASTTLAAGLVSGVVHVRDDAPERAPAACADERDPTTGECAPPSLASRIDSYCIQQHLVRAQFEACLEFWRELNIDPSG